MLPYLALLFSPVLSRMSDPCAAVRETATAAFASAVRLLPLERAAEDPADWDAKTTARVCILCLVVSCFPCCWPTLGVLL